MQFRSARLVAATFSLASFCVAAMTGVLVGNPPPMVLLRALAAMGICWVVGSIVGGIAQHLVLGELEAHRLRNPVDEVVLPGEVFAGAGDDDKESAAATPSAGGDEDILVV